MLTLVVCVVGPLLVATLATAARRAATAGRLRGLAVRDRWRLPRAARERLARALDDADVGLTPEAAVELWGVGILTLAVGAAAVAPGLVLPAVMAGAVGGPVGLHLARTRRERRFVVALPQALEQIAAELRGGGTVAGALERLGVEGGPVAADLRRVGTRTRLGLGLGDALAAWPTDHDGPGVRAAAGALALATTLGGAAAEALDGLAASLRHRLDAAAEARALSSQARLSAVVIGVAPVGYLAFAGVVDPRSVSALTSTGVGRVCLVVGLALEALGALWIRRIVRAEA